MTTQSLSPVLQSGELVDPVLVGIVVVMLAFVFFVYLFIRRTLTGFKEGMEESKRGR